MDAVPPESFAVLLRHYRIAAGLSQQALAERAGLSTRAISDLERGVRRAPYRDTVRMLAHGLGLTSRDQATLEASVDRSRPPRMNGGMAQADRTGGALPAAVTPLIGRDADVAAVCARLTDGSMRLLTLIGPPGIGKTRLALEVAAQLEDAYPAGVVLVPLASLPEARFVTTAILQALGLTEVGSRPASERLKDLLRSRHMLLVLDNIEHVIEAAPQVGELLESCPYLTVMATSRIALRLRGEHEFIVPPLAVPADGADETRKPQEIETLLDASAVELFVKRARAVKPGFRLSNDNAQIVISICRRLDGLPLAIELAAARCNVLTPRAILNRLEHRLDLLVQGARDAPERQRTLRGAIAWSHDLLADTERVLFRRLGVFAGGCTLTAMERVGNADDALGHDVLSVISALVDQSLVQQTEGEDGESRFIMLETLREFAVEQLEAVGERPLICAWHAADVLILAEETEPSLYTGERTTALRRLNEEQDNIRATLRWSLQEPDPELGLRLVGALWLWFLRRLLVEGRQWAEALLAHPDADRPTAARAGALFAAGHLAWLQGDVRTMRRHLEDATAIWRTVGDARGLGRALPFLGLAMDGDYQTARRLAYEGVAYCRTLVDQWHLALALLNLGRIEATQGRDDQARGPLQEATALFRAIGDPWLIGLPLTSLGAIAYRTGDFDAAEAAFGEALPGFRAVEDRRNTTQALTNLGFVALGRRDTAGAESIFIESLTLGQEHGDGFNSPACLRGLALTASEDDGARRAAELMALADHLSQATGVSRWPAERLGGPASVEALRKRIGDAELSPARHADSVLSLDHVIAEVTGSTSPTPVLSRHPASR